VTRRVRGSFLLCRISDALARGQLGREALDLGEMLPRHNQAGQR
jgi:hypothetical protein